MIWIKSIRRAAVMNNMNELDNFLKTVESGSFSVAAGLLGVTPAAVSKHVAKRERELGVRLFQRTTRSLTLTESGERLYAETVGPAHALRQAFASVTEADAQPAGTLRVSISPGFACLYVLPLLPEFLRRYPKIRLDWSFENRRVELVKEGFDAAIGSGLAGNANIVARRLLPLKLLNLGAPSYFGAHGVPGSLADLADHACIRLRSPTTGRLREWTFVTGSESVTMPVDGRLVLNDLDAVCDAAIAGMGLARLGAHQVLPYLDDGRLVQVLPEVRSPGGAIQVYYAHYRLTPPKVRVFVDFLTESFARSETVARLCALP